MNRRFSGLLGAAALVGASTLVAMLLGEAAARVVLNPADFLHAKLIDDPVLGQRIAPLTTGHDALGFRNAALPPAADIVAIGDSMTYGVSAPREGAWPQQLGGFLGERVYNMGLGGFGPLQYVHLAQSAAPPLKPRLMIVGFYFGNDLMDAYYVAHQVPHWDAWRVSAARGAGPTAFDAAGQAEPRKRFEALRNWLARNSMLYSVLRVTVFAPLAAREQDGMAAQAAPDVRMLWHDRAKPAVRTIFTPRYRLSAVDTDLEAVREGLQIAQKALAALQAAAERQGVQLLLVLIPTKERAYCRHLRQTGETLPESFVRLCEAEARTSAELARFLSARQIVHVDVTGALESQIERHAQLYPSDADGHPQSAGYAVIAQEVASTVRRRFPRPSPRP
jgi:lysophospholipase L1-like esterase